MPPSKRRKKALSHKQQKLKRKKVTTAAKRKQAKKHTPYVLLDSGKYVKRSGVKQQLYDRVRERDRNQRKYSKKLKTNRRYKKLYAYIKRYKATVTKKYIKSMKKAMEKAGYFSFEISWAEQYSITGLAVQQAIVKHEKITKFVGGRKVSEKKQNQRLKRAIRDARIKSYMDILGISKKKAQEIYRIFTKHLPGEFELKALIY